jgi:polygalacturonase
MVVALNTGTDITIGSHSTHIARIVKDTIVVITGSTYRYTVDTPEGEGSISTKATDAQLISELASKDGSVQQYLVTGDRLIVTAQDGKTTKAYHIVAEPGALSGRLRLQRGSMTANTKKDLVLYFTAGQRSPDAAVKIYFPAGIDVTMDNTTVNVIGRGDVRLKDLAAQSIGRVGTHYSYSRVGNGSITPSANGGSLLTFTGLDLRPANGPDLRIVIRGVRLSKTGKYSFSATYTTSKPEILTSAGTGTETATLDIVSAISDLERVIERGAPYKEEPDTYTKASFTWSRGATTTPVRLMRSEDKGKTWTASGAIIDPKRAMASITGLTPNKLYAFRLSDKTGGFSNLAWFYSGKMDIKSFGVAGEDHQDYTEKINEAIGYLHGIGGGTLLFTKGIYSVRTVHLMSNVTLYVEKGATITALKGTDEPEPSWFSDKKYRSGLSPTDEGPYTDPENFLTKEDVGHHYFRNALFFGERIDNVKIIGNGLITGNGNLVTGDRVMNNAPDNRGDKMFCLKLCTNLEIGGIKREEDLWYDSVTNKPYYIGKGDTKIETSNMLHIDRGGHFALLGAGTDGINMHDIYLGELSTASARDIFDFMECNNVTVTNIFSRSSGDDIIKPGSDCALGFTRPAAHYKVRNIIGSTNCNLFQIGSETADDITDLDVDNIYVLGANKAGFSISTNDGAHIRNVCLNCGHTGPVHYRSRMYRTTTPFFISISNRGRILGADVGKYAFTDNGVKHNELLVKNVNIGEVENITLNGIDISEVYAGASGGRSKPYDGSQRRATPIIAGYSLPDTKMVEGGLDFTLPNGKHTGYIKNIVFNDVHMLVKGGNPATDTLAAPPELGVGQYNVSNLNIQPSYGIWARHVKGLTIKDCSFNYEQRDGRYAFFLDDVTGARISSVKVPFPMNNDPVVKLSHSSGISVGNIAHYDAK